MRFNRFLVVYIYIKVKLIIMTYKKEFKTTYKRLERQAEDAYAAVHRDGKQIIGKGVTDYNNKLGKLQRHLREHDKHDNDWLYAITLKRKTL